MDRIELFRNLMVMAASDGKITEEEIALLAERSNRWGVTNDQFAAALKYAMSPSAVFSMPEATEARRLLLREMVRMMASDGELAEIEKQLFAIAAARLGVSDLELNRLLDQLLAEGSDGGA